MRSFQAILFVIAQLIIFLLINAKNAELIIFLLINAKNAERVPYIGKHMI